MQEGFLAEAVSGSLLNIYVLDADVYRAVLPTVEGDGGAQLTARRNQRPAEVHKRPGRSGGRSNERRSENEAPLRVLISYTSNSPEQRGWVKDLYRFLRENGVDARLDTYSLRLGGDVVQWMCNELQLADRVLLVCDERYARRADGRHGGVGWETMLVQGDLFSAMYGHDEAGSDEQPDAGEKYIPIVRTPVLEDGRPKYLATKRVLHWPVGGPEGPRRRDLLRELYEVTKEPPLGPRPARL
jgi:hypothetical protein